MWRESAVRLSDSGVYADGLFLPGRDIARFLARDERCILAAVTLGAEADRLIESARIVSVYEGYMTDAAASVLAERRLDASVLAGSGENAAGSGKNRPRFSPGYGDLPLSVQTEFLSFLDAGRRIGLFASQDGLLTPRKSITAVIAKNAAPPGCETCRLSGDCERKKRGMTCGS
ncbi:MAG: hypothetical protein LBK41_07120 [Clostridiales bacterium]|nr:hypothetical protein [Clostridiales bacterium]